MRIDYFPLDVAANKAFFDRDIERKRLKNNIDTNTHTLITSPRRYGKTSLTLRTMSEMKLVGTQLDLMLASDTERMKDIILRGVSDITSKLASGQSKILELAKKIFQPFNSVETLEFGKLAIKFQSYTTKPTEIIVNEALQRLENLAKKLDKKIVLFLDEYQHVLSLPNILLLEAALRSFLQNAEYVTCIFSGSNRHILQKMFDDSSRPFYNMCDHIMLDRISSTDYNKHLNSLSRENWGKALEPDSLQLILDLTACHPYFVNALCRRLWQEKQNPSLEMIKKEWNQLAVEKRYEISNDFERLSPIQRTILIELAREPFSQPTSKESIIKIKASPSGISHAIEGLENHDFIYQDKQKTYHLLNPLMEHILRES